MLLNLSEKIITKEIIKYAIEIHKQYGPGLRERFYQECLYFLFKKAGFYVEKEKKIPVKIYDSKLFLGYRADLIVEKRVIIEVKSVNQISGLMIYQVINYLKLKNLMWDYY